VAWRRLPAMLGQEQLRAGTASPFSIRSRGAWAANIRTDLPELRASGRKSVTPAPTIEVDAEPGEALAVPVERAFAERTDGAIVRCRSGHGSWSATAARPADRLVLLPPSARGAAMSFHGRGMDQQLGGWALSACQGMKRLRPHALRDGPRSRAQ
jgi:hypothetical protein